MLENLIKKRCLSRFKLTERIERKVERIAYDLLEAFRAFNFSRRAVIAPYFAIGLGAGRLAVREAYKRIGGKASTERYQLDDRYGDEDNRYGDEELELESDRFVEPDRFERFLNYVGSKLPKNKWIRAGLAIGGGVLAGLTYLWLTGRLNDDDNDGIINLLDPHPHTHEEKLLDTDKDGISDYDEKYVYETNPKRVDTDGDGWTDREEIFELKTDPNMDSSYEITKKILGKLADQLKPFTERVHPLRYRPLVESIGALTEDGKKALEESGVVAEAAEDGLLSSAEERLLTDVDLDNIPNENDSFQFDPFNEKELEYQTKLAIIMLADYNKEKVGDGTMLDIYGNGLRSFRDAVEFQPKLIKDFDKYGLDWLTWVLKDNPDPEIVRNHWRLLHGNGLDCQIYFYRMDDYTPFYLDFRKPITGMMTNRVYDPEEREAYNEYLRLRLEWEKNGEVLIPSDDSITEIFKDETVQENNLDIPLYAFIHDIRKGKTHELIDLPGTVDPDSDTDKWIEVFRYNVSQLSSVHKEIIDMWNNPEMVKKYIEDRGLYERYVEGNPYSDYSKQFKIVLDTVLNEGKDFEKKSLLLAVYVDSEKGFEHEDNVDTTPLYFLAVGGSSRRAGGVIPGGYPDPYTMDGKASIPYSDQTLEKLREKIPKLAYDPEKNDVPLVYCDKAVAERYSKNELKDYYSYIDLVRRVRDYKMEEGGWQRYGKFLYYYHRKN